MRENVGSRVKSMQGRVRDDLGEPLKKPEMSVREVERKPGVDGGPEGDE